MDSKEKEEVMGSLVLGAGVRGALAISTAIAAALAAAALAPPASAQSLSPGCKDANDPIYDGSYGDAGWIFPRTFAAGERLTVNAQRPTDPAPPSSITLRINNVEVNTVPFPGTISYTFTEAGGYTAEWIASTDPHTGRPNVTWSVSCSRAVGLGSPPPKLLLPTSKKQCKHGGWKKYGSDRDRFKNQGECVRFVEHHHPKHHPGG